ncbi:MAG: hypothetical protein RQ824_12270 [bacterium]|nr:hypothetical protein [bacterium]
MQSSGFEVQSGNIVKATLTAFDSIETEGNVAPTCEAVNEGVITEGKARFRLDVRTIGSKDMSMLSTLTCPNTLILSYMTNC